MVECARVQGVSIPADHAHAPMLVGAVRATRAGEVGGLLPTLGSDHETIAQVIDLDVIEGYKGVVRWCDRTRFVDICSHSEYIMGH